MSYECPECGEWLEIKEGVQTLDCTCCGEPLEFDADAEFRDGMWHDLSKLVSLRPHMKKMLEHSRKSHLFDY